MNTKHTDKNKKADNRAKKRSFWDGHFRGTDGNIHEITLVDIVLVSAGIIAALALMIYVEHPWVQGYGYYVMGGWSLLMALRYRSSLSRERPQPVIQLGVPQPVIGVGAVLTFLIAVFFPSFFPIALAFTVITIIGVLIRRRQR